MFPRCGFQLADGNAARKLLLAAFGIVLALAFGLSERGPAQPSGTDDPVPIRRVQVSQTRLMTELERAKAGGLVPLARDEFESRVRRARDGSHVVPRLLRANYRATLENGTLVNGRGEWTVQLQGVGPAVLNMANSHLALSQLRDADNKEAILGEFDDKSLGLLVEKPGNQRYYFDWSLRGLEAADGRNFAFVVPACAAATLELRVPADHFVTVAPGVAMLTGPHESESPKQHLWRMSFTGRSQIEFSTKKQSGPERKPEIFASVRTRQQLLPGRCLADFDCQVEVLHGHVDRLVFVCAADIEPYQVAFHNPESIDPALPGERAVRPPETGARPLELKGWEIQESPAATKGKPPERLLVVTLREPAQGILPTLRVRCLGPLSADRAWTSPGLQLRQVLTRGELLQITLHPEVRLENWQPGQFQMLRTNVDAEGQQVLVLGRSGAASAERPTGTARFHGVEFMARRKCWWRIDTHETTLTAEIVYEVQRGSLFQLDLQLPEPQPEWTVDSIQFKPGKKAPTWQIAGQHLLIDLERPLTADDDGRLTVRLRSRHSRPWPISGEALAFADLAPAQACLHAGELGISIDPALEAKVLSTAVSPGPVNLQGPWGKNTLDFLFSYRQQAAKGALWMQPRRPRLQCQVVTDVNFSGTQASWQTQLDVAARASKPSSIDLLISAANSPGQLRWKSEPEVVRRLVRDPVAEILPDLLALGCRSNLEQDLLRLALPRGQRWRIELSRPFDKRVQITLEAPLEHQPSKDSQTWDIPLVTVLGAEHQEMMIAARSLGTELNAKSALGLKMVDALTVKAGQQQGSKSAAEMLFQNDPAAQFPQLIMSTRAQVGAESSGRELCDRAVLVSELQPDGALVHHLRFDLVNWRKSSVPVVLPAGTNQILGVRGDGRWIDSFSRRTAADGVQIVLPVPAGGVRHVLEITYSATEAPAGFISNQLVAPIPRLPLPPVAFERRWRLPADVVPLHWSAYRATTPAALSDSLPALAQVRHFWRLGDSLLERLGVRASPDWLGEQRQRMAEANVALRKKTSRKRQLGEFLQSLAVDHLGTSTTLVLDAAALEAASMGPGASIDFPALAAKNADRSAVWEVAGLVYVPCRPAPVLTTRAALDSWPDRSAVHAGLPAWVRPVQQAVAHGQDSSGRFRTVADWLAAALATSNSRSTSPGAALVPDHLPGWVEWAPVPGLPDADEITVVNRRFLDGAGLALALALFLVALPIRNRLSGVWRFRLWLGWLGIAVVGCIWLPNPFRLIAAWLVLAAVLMAALGWVRRLLGGRGPALAVASPTTTVAGALLAAGLLLAGMVPAHAQGQKPYTVFLLPGKNSAETVLAPSELLERLDKLARTAAPFQDKVVLVSARYRGTFNGSTADFKVDFSCYNFADKAQLFVPLDGVELLPSAFLDGAPVYPVVAAMPATGYVVTVQGKGAHLLTLSFAVRSVSVGESQELKFAIPRLAQNHLELLAPAQLQDVQVVDALGSQVRAKSGNDRSLKAQLGPRNALQVRWRSATSKSGPAPQIEVRELYYWDLRLPSPHLSGTLNYSISKGEVASLSVSLPAAAEVQTVEVAAAGMFGEPRLKSWRVRGDKERALVVDLAAPVSGKFQLRFGLALLEPIQAGNLSLSLPYPLQIKPAGFQEGFLAYRVDRLEARENPKDLGVIGMAPAAFVKEWRRADPRSEVQPTRAFNFSRNSPKANLGLTLLNPAYQASQEVTWEVQRHHADMTATCEIQAPSSDMAMIQWHVPPVVVLADVYGSHVHSWTRQGALVQVWLTQPHKETRITLSGWMQNASPLRAGKTGAFALPAVSLRQPAPSATVVRLQPEQGLQMEPVKIQQLRPLPTDEPRSLAYAPAKLPGDDYAAAFRIREVPAAPTYRSLTVSRLRNQRLLFATHLQVHLPPGGAPPLTVRLRHWPADDVHLEVPASLPQPQVQKDADGLSWLVQLPPGLPDRIVLRLHGAISWGSPRELVMPQVSIKGASAQERWLGVIGPELSGAPGKNVKPAKSVDSSLAAWPDEAKELRQAGGVWQALADDWSMTVQPRAAPLAPSIQVLFCERDSALNQDGRWTHAATFQLFGRDGGAVRLRLPGRCRLLALELDGQPADARPDGDHWRVSVPRSTITALLCVRWQRDEMEPISEPDLASPTIAGLDSVNVAGTVWLPPDFRDPTLTGGKELPTAEWMLLRARAQSQLTSWLTQKRKDLDPAGFDAALRRSQATFYWCCRQAEYLAARSGQDTVLTAVKELQQSNAALAEKHLFAKIQKTVAKSASLQEPPANQGLSALHATGLPYHWQAAAGGTGPTPVLRLGVIAVEQDRDRLLATQGVLMAILGLLLLSFFPVLARYWRALWPEQVLLLGCLGWFAFGPSLPGIVMILFSVAARLILLARWCQRWLARDAAAQGSASSLHP